jgi:hypothetical protein
MAEPTPQQRIEADLRTAMKASEKERVGTLRMLLTDVKNERIRRGGEVDEAGFVAQVRKGIKRCEEAAEQFDKGGRPEQAAKERREAEILASYLPAGPSEAEIRAAVEAYAAEHDLSGPQAMGRVMPAMIQRFEGRADNAVVSRVAREVLSQRSG